MLVRLLKDRGLFPFLAAVVLGIVLLISRVFMIECEASGNDLLATHWAFSWLFNQHGLRLFIGGVLVAISAVQVRFLTRSSKLVSGSGNVTMLIFISILLIQKNIFLNTDVLAATAAIIGSCSLIFSTYGRSDVLSRLFHAGMFLGLASIFVGQSVLLLVSVYLTVALLRSGNWRERTAPILGILILIVFVFMVLVWKESPLLEFQWLIQTAWSETLFTPRFSVGHIIFAVVFSFFIPQVMASLTGGAVVERNFSLALFAWFAVAILTVPVLGLGWQSGVVFSAFPISVFIAKGLVQISRWWLADLILVIVLVAPFLSSL